MLKCVLICAVTLFCSGNSAILNFQPLVPTNLHEHWHFTSRMIGPVVRQYDVAGNTGTRFGLGDTTQSLFLPPQAPGPGGSFQVLHESGP